VIEVSDQELKEKLYELTNQKQIKTCNRFFIFCADYNKISIGAEAKGIGMPAITNTADGLILGVVDASLAMMSAITAAESCGLGTCPIGYARTAAPEEFAKLLKLPKGVFVVCGLAIGVPREYPDLKPKEPEELLIFNNTYPDSSSLKRSLMEYDAQITEYNSKRSGTKSDNDWIGHITDYYKESLTFELLKVLRDRGFNISK